MYTVLAVYVTYGTDQLREDLLNLLNRQALWSIIDKIVVQLISLTKFKG